MVSIFDMHWRPLLAAALIAGIFATVVVSGAVISGTQMAMAQNDTNAAGGGSANADTVDTEMTFPMTAASARYWQFVSDRVMGGVSDGQLRFTEDTDRPFARMTGDVSTANNGGFIQFRAGISFAGAADGGAGLSGIKVTARGNGETYYVHLRTRDNRRPQHYYAAPFTVDDDWQTFTLPFASFRHSWGMAPDHPSAEDLTSIGIVAYGRDHRADISVASVAFY